MKAMILAAGLGTRLRPLTWNRPKALIPVGNIPIINRVITYLKKFGVRDIVVNAHHHADQMREYLQSPRDDGVRLELRIEREILGTGGGIKNTADFWDDAPFLVINSDILTDIDLEKAYESHMQNRSLATLILHDEPRYSQIQIDDRLNLLDIGEKKQPGRLAFTGIQIISPGLLSYIPDGVFSSIIHCYRKLIHSGKKVRGFVSNGHYWLDMGTVETYVRANRDAMGDQSLLLGPECKIHPGARFKDWVTIGASAVIEDNVEITRSILWENVRVKAGARITDSIVTASKEVHSDLTGKIL
jgi:mannose-1-phosphate guanylyltransferase